MSLLWRGNFFLVIGGYISPQACSIKFPGIFLAGHGYNAVLIVIFAFGVQTRGTKPNRIFVKAL
jgi:hypothetical protein